jgi:MFS family permease
MEDPREKVEEQYVEKDGKWYDSNGKQVWKAGTLVYDRKGLIRLFSWLYIGQFTFWLENIATPLLFPLLMAQKGFVAAEIGALWAIYPLGALVLFPIIGTLSDRTRTRWGRRRPWDAFTTPIWFIGLVALPFIEDQNFTQAMICMVLIGFAGAGSNVLNAYYNDVVPPELLGRFNAGMRMLGSIGGLLVNLVALRLFDDYPIAVFIALAVLGFCGEMLMLYKVKEGEYPPPPPKVSILKTVGEFLKEGFANRYIIFLWLTLGMTALGGPVMGIYFNNFITNTETGLGYSTTQLGYMGAIGTVVSMALLLPAGWFVDRFGPKKIWMIGGLLVGLANISMYFFAKDLVTVTILFTIYASVNILMIATLLPVMYCFMPQDKFGQLNGSNQIVARLLQIIGVTALGWLITFNGEDYRIAFLYGGVAYLLSPLFMWLMLRQPWPYGDMTTSMNPDGSHGKQTPRQ